MCRNTRSANGAWTSSSCVLSCRALGISKRAADDLRLGSPVGSLRLSAQHRSRSFCQTIRPSLIPLQGWCRPLPTLIAPPADQGVRQDRPPINQRGFCKEGHVSWLPRSAGGFLAGADDGLYVKSMQARASRYVRAIPSHGFHVPNHRDSCKRIGISEMGCVFSAGTMFPPPGRNFHNRTDRSSGESSDPLHACEMHRDQR